MKRNKTRTFYRIETLDMAQDGVPKSGYMGPLTAILCKMLGLKVNHTPEELHKALNTTRNPEIMQFWGYIMCLIDIPIPEIYKQNKNTNNYYCLYTREEYKEAAEILKDLQYEMSIYLPQYSFKYKKFKLSEEELLYEDGYQVVIAKDVYDKHFADSEYRSL